MANSTVHALTDGTTPATTDEFYVSRSPYGSGDDRKLTWAQLKAASAGAELDYAQITSGVSITATTDATATTVITGSAVSYDGSTRIKLEYFLGASINSGSEIVFVVYDGSTDLGRCSSSSNQGTAAIDVPVPGAMFLTPSAATHTFSVRAWKIGTASVYAGAGGDGVTLPAWYRITRA